MAILVLLGSQAIDLYLLNRDERRCPGHVVTISKNIDILIDRAHEVFQWIASSGAVDSW